MKYHKTLFTMVLSFSAALLLQACMGMQLIPRSANQDELKGTYTLIQYGCRHPADLENMAILVDESGPYPVEVYALDSLYKVKKGLPASQALGEANTFINCSFYTVWQSMLRRISDNMGRTIGYELKPVYRPWEISTTETLLTSYILKDNKITVYITPNPSLERQTEAGDGGRGHDQD
jgi:hypothetical protein